MVVRGSSSAVASFARVDDFRGIAANEVQTEHVADTYMCDVRRELLLTIDVLLLLW